MKKEQLQALIQEKASGLEFGINQGEIISPENVDQLIDFLQSTSGFAHIYFSDLNFYNQETLDKFSQRLSELQGNLTIGYETFVNLNVNSEEAAEAKKVDIYIQDMLRSGHNFSLKEVNLSDQNVHTIAEYLKSHKSIFLEAVIYNVTLPSVDSTKILIKALNVAEIQHIYWEEVNPSNEETTSLLETVLVGKDSSLGDCVELA
jgi:hypothetical protein